MARCQVSKAMVIGQHAGNHSERAGGADGAGPEDRGGERQQRRQGGGRGRAADAHPKAGQGDRRRERALPVGPVAAAAADHQVRIRARTMPVSGPVSHRSGSCRTSVPLRIMLGCGHGRCWHQQQQQQVVRQTVERIPSCVKVRTTAEADLACRETSRGRSTSASSRDVCGFRCGNSPRAVPCSAAVTGAPPPHHYLLETDEPAVAPAVGVRFSMFTPIPAQCDLGRLMGITITEYHCRWHADKQQPAPAVSSGSEWCCSSITAPATNPDPRR